MGTIKITAEDGHQFDAYLAEPKSESLRAALIVVQEIFGVNSHIRSVADGYAAQGYLSIAPALFDRAEPNVELSYNSEDSKRGMGMAAQIGMDNMLKDVAASIQYARQKWPALKIGVVGFVWAEAWRGSLPLGWAQTLRLATMADESRKTRMKPHAAR